MNQISTLVQAHLQAFPAVFKYRLLQYYIYAGLIAVGIFLLFGGAVYLGLSSYLSSVIGVGSTTLGIVIATAAVVLFLLVFKHIVLIATSPLVSVMSERIEKKATGELVKSELNFVQSISRSLKLSMRNLGMELLITLVLLALGLIPLLTIVTTPLIFIVQAYYAGFANMDLYYERRCTIKQSKQNVRRNALFAIGNGSVFLALLMIPILGMFIAPGFSGTAATLGCIEFNKKKS